MKVLVTGGAGFIGSNFVRFLMGRKDVRVANLDKLTYASVGLDEESVRREIGDHPLIRADICEPETYASKLKGMDAVVHFAAETHVDRSFDDAEPFKRTNEVGTARLLEAAAQNGVRRFVHISTDEVYGEAGKGELKREEDRPNPTNPYSRSKLQAELAVSEARLRFGEKMSISIVRGTNNYGPYQFPEKVIPFFITRALAGEPLPVYGDGLHEREWLFVEDFCKAIWLVLEKGAPGEIYNAGSGERLSNRALAERILKLASGHGAGPNARIVFVNDRPVHDRRYAVNFEKITRLGYRPVHAFSEMLPTVFQWYRQHGPWWTGIIKRKAHRDFQNRWYGKRQKAEDREQRTEKGKKVS